MGMGEEMLHEVRLQIFDGEIKTSFSQCDQGADQLEKGLRGELEVRHKFGVREVSMLFKWKRGRVVEIAAVMGFGSKRPERKGRRLD